MKLTDFISDIGRPVAYYPGLKKITKSTTATILLCQLIYWTGKQADQNGWIYKTSADLEDETGLTYDEQKTARTQLIKLGFIEEIYRRLDHQMAFRIMANAINDNWRTGEQDIPESGKAVFPNAVTPDSGNGKHPIGEQGNMPFVNVSETTPQITPESTTDNTTENEADAFSLNELNTAFIKAARLNPFQLDRWSKALEELARMGATPADVTAAVEYSLKHLTVSGPWSIINPTAVAMSRRRQVDNHTSEKAGYTL